MNKLGIMSTVFSFSRLITCTFLKIFWHTRLMVVSCFLVKLIAPLEYTFMDLENVSLNNESIQYTYTYQV